MELVDVKVPSNKELVDRTVPSNKELVDGTVPSNSTIHVNNLDRWTYVTKKELLWKRPSYMSLVVLKNYLHAIVKFNKDLVSL